MYETAIRCDCCRKRIPLAGRVTKKDLDAAARNIGWWVGKVRGADAAYCNGCKASYGKE